MPDVDPVLARFGRAVKRARLLKGLGVRTGAVFLGVQPSQLQEIESGARDTSMSVAIKIARKLGLSLDQVGKL